MTTTAELAQPAHDLGLVSILEEEIANRTNLKDAIRSYLGLNSAGDGTSEGASNMHELSWSLVFEEVKQARSAYDKKAVTNSFRRCFRHGSIMHQNVKPMLEAIPQDDGLGLIKGGLLLVLNAVQRRSQTCDTIFETFESIPQRVWYAESLKRVYLSNRLLSHAVDKFYHELTKCLRLLIKILLREDQTRWKKYSKSLYDDSKAEVDTILRPMVAAEARLKECQLELISQGVVDISGLARKLVCEHQVTRDFVQQEIKSAQCETHEKLVDLQGRFCARIIQEFRQIMKNEQYIFVKEHERVEAIFQANAIPPQMPPQVGWVYATVDARRQLMESLCDPAESEAASCDRASILRGHHVFSAKALGRVNQLVSMLMFRQWIAALHSDILIVNGHCGDDTTGSTSAMSVFCASLIQTFVEPAHDQEVDDWTAPMFLPQSPQIILEYFGGQHNVYASGLDDPSGMIRSLLHQLLRQWPHGAPLNLQGYQQSYSSGNLSTAAMCALFEFVVAQLPVRFPVWCVVDNISHFETELGGLVNELNQVVECFRRCVQRQIDWGNSAPVKILLATANRSIYIWEQIPDRQVDLTDSHLSLESPGSAIFHSLLEN